MAQTTIADLETPLDLSDYETAEEAAKKLHQYLSIMFDTDAVRLYAPDENPRQNDCWAVSWESGPYEWAIKLTGGDSLAYGEFPEVGPGNPEVVGFYNDDWSAEPYFSFDLQFYEEVFEF